MRRALIERPRSFLCAIQIQTRTEVAKDIRRARELFRGLLRLGDCVSAAQFIMSARAAITIAKQIKNRHAAAEVLRRHRGIAATHFEQAVQALRLAGQQQVRRRIGYQLREIFKVRLAGLSVAASEQGFGQQ